jgi:hypothetical protein
MTQIESIEASLDARDGIQWHGRAALAAASGALGIGAAVWAYWLVVPCLVFGIIAVVLGAWSHRRGAREAGTVAVALGIAAVLLVPSVRFVVAEAEDWGRDCALNPTNPDC